MLIDTLLNEEQPYWCVTLIEEVLNEHGPLTAPEIALRMPQFKFKTVVNKIGELTRAGIVNREPGMRYRLTPCWLRLRDGE